MQLTIMSAAEQQLGNLYSASATTQINGFRVQGSVNASIDALSNGPQGPILYSGLPSQIKYIPVSEHEVIFVAYLDDTIGDFRIGNVMFYINPAVGSQAPIPFLLASLPSASEKDADNFAKYKVGNIVMVHCACWFPYITEIIDFSNLELFIAEFVAYDNEKLVPVPAASEYEQITIGTHSNYDAATLVVRDNARLRWQGMCFSQFIEDSYLGQIDGGFVGQPYGSPAFTTISGGKYLQSVSPNEPVLDGGIAWAVANEPAVAGGAY